MKKFFKSKKSEGLPNGPNYVNTTAEGFIITNRGQWDFPGENTLIPSNNITMRGVPYPVFGMDDTGYSQMMYPGAEYTFPGNMVYEIPMAQVGLQTGKENLPIYSRENYVKDIEANTDKLFNNGTYITPYKAITKPDEKNCINGICYLTRKLTNDALNIDYISNPDFKDDLNKNNFYTTNLEDGFEIGDILQYYTRKGSTFSGFPGKVTPANANDPWPQHAISIVGKRTDNNGKTFIKIVNNRGTDVAKVEEISELDLMKRAQEGYKHYDGILINRYDPEKVQELNRIKKENTDIFSGKNKYAKEYDNAIYTGAYKPKDIVTGKTLGEDASSIEFRKVINELYPTLGKSSNMPKEQFDILMNYLYGIGMQESNWDNSIKKEIKDIIPESAYSTLRKWSDSNEDDWRQDYWNKNVNNVKTKYKNIEEFKNTISEKKIDPEVSEYLRLNSPKSKGIFQQKEPSERGRYFNYGFDDTKSQIANAAALLIDNYHKVKKKFPNKPERELYQLAVLMHNSPSRALNPIYADYYPKNNDIDYFNKVESYSAQPQFINKIKPIKSQTISESEKQKIVKFLDQFKSTGGNVYSNGGTFNPETDEFIEFIDELPKAQVGIQKMYPDATSININLPQIDPKDKFIIQKNNSNIPKPTRSPFEELQYLDSQARSNYFDTISKLDSWPKLSGKTINLTTDRYRGAKVPIEYINMLTESANRFKIDPYLLYAIAGRESTFGQGSDLSKERASTPINLVSGWNLTESYEPYSPERFLADNKTPNITLDKNKTQYTYGIDYGENNNNLNTINEYITKNNLLDKYKTKLSKTKKINYTNPFDFLSEFIINKGIEKYNPGDPDYKNKINNEIRLLKMDPEFSKYVNQKGKGGLVKAQEGKENKLRKRNQSNKDDVLLGPTLNPVDIEYNAGLGNYGFGPTARKYIPSETGWIQNPNWRGGDALEYVPVEALLTAPAAKLALTKYGPSIGNALISGLRQSLPGMSTIPGATYGNLLGSIGATDAITNRIPQIPGQLSRGEYADAAANALMGGLDLYGANMISPLSKGAGNFFREQVYKAVDPYGYGVRNKILKAPQTWVRNTFNPSARPERIGNYFNPYGAYSKDEVIQLGKNRLDAFRLGLNLEQDYNTFRNIGNNTYRINAMKPKEDLFNDLYSDILANEQSNSGFYFGEDPLINIANRNLAAKARIGISDPSVRADFFRRIGNQNTPWKQTRIVEKAKNPAFRQSIYDSDTQGIMGSYRWDVKKLDDGNIHFQSNDTWNLNPWENRGQINLAQDTKSPNYRKWNPFSNLEFLSLVGGKPFNIQNNFIVDPKTYRIIDSYKKGGSYNPNTDEFLGFID